MKNRDFFSGLLKYTKEEKRVCYGKNVTDYPELLSEMYYRQLLLMESFGSWDAEKGIQWLIGYANYINQNNEYKQNKRLISRKFKFGEIIDVDFFGGFTNELTYDHPAVALKDVGQGLLIAPITSNSDVYKNADKRHTHIKLPKDALPLGYMAKNSTIKLEQTRYISKARVLRLRERQRVLKDKTIKIQEQKITDKVKQDEIKYSLINIFSATLMVEQKKKLSVLQKDFDSLTSTYKQLSGNYSELEQKYAELIKQMSDLEVAAEIENLD